MVLLRAEVTSDQTSLEGLEPLFETVTTSPSSNPANIAQEVVTVTNAHANWTLRETAERLGISQNTVRNRIKAGQLHGCKVTGSNGPEWRITPPIDTPAVSPQKSEGLQALLQVIESQTRQIELMTKQLDANAVQLKAAADVVTYMHEQVREKTNEIKLLTDSQQNAGWWRRAMRWFTGTSVT